MHMHNLKLLRRTVWEVHLQENKFLDLGVKVTQNVAQYPLHYVTYAAAKFGVVMSYGLGGDAFTRKCIL